MIKFEDSRTSSAEDPILRRLDRYNYFSLHFMNSLRGSWHFNFEIGFVFGFGLSVGDSRFLEHWSGHDLASCGQVHILALSYRTRCCPC